MEAADHTSQDFPPEVDEMTLTKLTKIPSVLVRFQIPNHSSRFVFVFQLFLHFIMVLFWREFLSVAVVQVAPPRVAEAALQLECVSARTEARHTSRVTRLTSRITHHTSHITHHTSHVTHHQGCPSHTHRRRSLDKKPRSPYCAG